MFKSHSEKYSKNGVLTGVSSTGKARRLAFFAERAHR
jgi:hypothetical protein